MHTDKQLSKTLSYILRHRPDEYGLTPDDAGWVEVDALLAALTARNRRVTRDDLERVVRDNDKQRFALSDDGARIRASQGHSIEVALGYTPREPPALLYHGTVARVLAAIRSEGLIRQTRQHVHLSATRETAVSVGARRGRPIVLEVEAAAMHADGHPFYLSDNGVWLADHVPPRYLRIPDDLHQKEGLRDEERS